MAPRHANIHLSASKEPQRLPRAVATKLTPRISQTMRRVAYFTFAPLLRSFVRGTVLFMNKRTVRFSELIKTERSEAAAPRKLHLLFYSTRRKLETSSPPLDELIVSAIRTCTEPNANLLFQRAGFQ